MIRTRSTPASKISRTPILTPGGQKSREEKIFVTVRVRPLSQKEQEVKDEVAWDFRDVHTIVPKSKDRSCGPYCFDRVFDPSCATQKVYDEGARDVALSALTGINATIFAYGQTSSGKTFTMRGITENVVKDIFEHIRSTPEREFDIKFSALEIYNETVIDLLNRDSGPLRLLDDPEKGIIVDKQVEEVAKDSQHLKSLIGICEAQRQVGETALNDTSSRSHQIIKLLSLLNGFVDTVESSLREHLGDVKSYIASLNLVDLAGSERASQTNVDDTRLKEGSHINRSLLTLMTVIRKLSDGRRRGHIHIPYRDSKLTRILQPSLGGNSRTAIICTMSPALSHIEQSRNTLLFATSAKEVTNTAEVNMVVAEKQLVRQLQNQVASKDKENQQMKLEIEELKRQRDLAQSELDLERKLSKNQKVRCLSFSTENCPDMWTPNSLRRKKNNMGRNAVMLGHEIRKLEHRQRQLGEEANQALEVLHQEVASHGFGSQDAAETVAKLLAEIKGLQVICEKMAVRGNTKLKMKMLSFPLRNSTYRSPIIRSPCSPTPSSTNVTDFEKENKSPQNDDFVTLQNTCEATPPKSGGGNGISLLEGTPARQPKSGNMKKIQTMFMNAMEENIRSMSSYVTEWKEWGAKIQYQKNLLVDQVLVLEENDSSAQEQKVRNLLTLKEWVAKLQYQKQLLVEQVLELEENEQSPFEEQIKQIIMLWHLCHVSIVHRSKFYLLFRGDMDDQCYIEVELRWLIRLEQQLAEVGNASPALLGDEPASPVASRVRTLKQERKQLSKRVTSRFSQEELEMLYLKWDIPPGGKQRRLELVNKLWTDPHNMDHIQDSAEVVTKLVDSCESSKDMFQLKYVSHCSDKKSWMGWNPISNLLNF